MGTHELADNIDSLTDTLRVQHKSLETLPLTVKGLKVASRMRDIVALLSVASSLVDDRIEAIYWYGPAGSNPETLAGLVKENR